ncbi:hypothetical protein EDB83DRAFT_2316192 [Lactarius deliciosus]|nr:hypothetical protein EDB83DRAFT_2316192 [Lactarius deliciosus]
MHVPLAHQAIQPAYSIPDACVFPNPCQLEGNKTKLAQNKKPMQYHSTIEAMVVCNQLVKPSSPIADYLTRAFDDLLGHSLESDLYSLQLFGIDTAILPPPAQSTSRAGAGIAYAQLARTHYTGSPARQERSRLMRMHGRFGEFRTDNDPNLVHTRGPNDTRTCTVIVDHGNPSACANDTEVPDELLDSHGFRVADGGWLVITPKAGTDSLLGADNAEAQNLTAAAETKTGNTEGPATRRQWQHPVRHSDLQSMSTLSARQGEYQASQNQGHGTRSARGKPRELVQCVGAQRTIGRLRRQSWMLRLVTVALVVTPCKLMLVCVICHYEALMTSPVVYLKLKKRITLPFQWETSNTPPVPRTNSGNLVPERPIQPPSFPARLSSAFSIMARVDAVRVTVGKWSDVRPYHVGLSDAPGSDVLTVIPNSDRSWVSHRWSRGIQKNTRATRSTRQSMSASLSSEVPHGCGSVVVLAPALQR